MLRVVSSKPFKIVYSLCKHEYLGYLIEPHVVQLNPQGDFSLTHQRLFSHTAEEFSKNLSELDFKLIKILDQIEQDHLIKKYHKKAVRALEFFSKSFDESFYEAVRPKIEKKMSEVLDILKDCDNLYMMDANGWPAEHKIEMATEKATVLFHFRRNELETRYFPTIKYKGQRIEFMFKNAQVISNFPAWMLLNDVLYYFDQDIEGKKLLPFLNKRYITIPKNTEETYFEKFVTPLIERYSVYAEGFEIISEKFNPSAIIEISNFQGDYHQIQLSYQYGNYTIDASSSQKITVHLEKKEDTFIFHRLKRDLNWERDQLQILLKLGLKKSSPLSPILTTTEVDNEIGHYDLLNWVNEHIEELQELGFTIKQNTDGGRKYLLATSKITFDVKEDNDWFDIHAVVYFGHHAIPFLTLKPYILKKKREFILPDGEIAIIPEKWFTQYSSLLNLGENGGDSIKLKQHHLGLIQDLGEDSIAHVTMERKLQQLSNFEEIEDIEMPVHFNGKLRSYQKAGYNWFNFLRKYNFGGCLADDMGLGKTIQTLALLQKLKEEASADAIQSTSLIVMPTSLIYNWLNEAKKFSPKLKILSHTGSFRSKDVQKFANYDVVITTYGVTRVDIDLLSHYYFQYIILDESQNIKNPSSKSFKAVRALKSKYRLILSGTPVENTVGDLWTQLTFLNPGLLGTQTFFNEEYVHGIEKKKDEEKARKLQAIIKPFVLRRTKEQVASELPDKTEQIFYCDMSEEQSNVYEKTKAAYRNDLLIALEEGGSTKKNVQLLQGLTALRQLANHPRLVDDTYDFDSGKFENVLFTLDNVLKGGHKILVFSQFVKHLALFKSHLDEQNTPYAYLDGSTKNRGEVVQQFQTEENLKIFLISIKAGGVGLNLTEADYVFILDPWWNPAVEQQAVDRTHRIGQTKKVFIYKFIAKDTVEEKILALQNRKKKIASSLITTEESFIKSLSKTDIQELLA